MTGPINQPDEVRHIVLQLLLSHFGQMGWPRVLLEAPQLIVEYCSTAGLYYRFQNRLKVRCLFIFAPSGTKIRSLWPGSETQNKPSLQQLLPLRNDSLFSWDLL